MNTKENLIIDTFLAADSSYEEGTEVEVDWTWATGTVDLGSLVDYVWLSVYAMTAREVLRYRFRYQKGHWCTWRYVYAPEYIMVPEEF